ncbi:hypothetical protein BMS3Bbin10_00345 [bacterium BMS3Bbin10]|nr:hypothetical protein BMS3Bbin10_00345 [bacterium BMS3Bbin10]
MVSGRGVSLIFRLALALALLVGAAAAARPAELVMFEQAFCEWCEAWEEEVGVVYDKTDEGKRAPVRRVDIHSQRPADLRGVKRIVFTPTFVLMENGAEVGRILGYPGEDHFWGLLDRILKRLPGEHRESAALAARPGQGKEKKK